jgi:DNA-binding beta-propeller fold protein YncE
MKTPIVTTIFLALCFGISAQEAFQSDKLVKVWSTPAGLNVPESSHYNPSDNTIYVSNIVGKHNVKDGEGFISKINTKGEFIEKEWVKGLNAPKGVTCSKTKLYVTDIDRVVEISLKSGKILKEYRNAKSKSLNDVCVAENGRVYVSDDSGDCIFYVGKDSLEVLVKDKSFGGMNGIYASGNLLYLGSKGNFISVDQNTKAITILQEKVGYLDGIEQIAPTEFVTSDWSGHVQLIEVGKGVEKLLDSTPQKINAADVGYIPSLKLLLVPTFLDNRVVAYKLNLKK